MKTVAEKMRIPDGIRAWVQPIANEQLPYDLPTTDVASTLTGTFGFLHVFVLRQDELEREIDRLKPHLAERGSLWVSWPKGRGRGSDLTLHHVIRIAYARGLVESVCMGVDETWSALKLTHPKPGKAYFNSHAELLRD